MFLCLLHIRLYLIKKKKKLLQFWKEFVLFEH